jgi:cation:H+ antiporter
VLGADFPIWANILLLLIGLAVITKGADKFVDSSVVIAHRTRVPKAIIGATIVSVGTTLPEFSVVVIAGVFAHSPTAIGNAIGSTICNIGLILGTCILIKPVFTHRRLYWQQGVIMLLAGVIITLLSIDGYLSRWDSLILTAGLVGYLYVFTKQVSAARKDITDGAANIGQIHVTADVTAYSIRRAVVWFIIGAVGVGIGATLIVQNAVIIADWLGIPELIIGLTVVALGTSLPEYVTGLTAVIKGHEEIAVGNIIGADILDIFWVLGLGALSFPRLPVERQTIILDFPVMLAFMVLLVVFGLTGKKLARWEGGIFLGMYAGYLALMFLQFA